MTALELAKTLTGREYGDEITEDEAREAAKNGLVVVYGYSDDTVEFDGAITAEKYCDSGDILLEKDGILTAGCGNDDCPYFRYANNFAKVIKAKRRFADSPCWSFETDIPHETFEIFDDGELFCIGIVFNVEDLG